MEPSACGGPLITEMNLSRDRSRADQEVRRVEFDECYLEHSWRWLNDPEVRRLTNTPTFSQDDQRRWFEGLSGRDDYVIWGIEVGGKPVGAFGLKNITSESAEFFGYVGEREYWGRGIAQWGIRIMEEEARLRGAARFYLRMISERERGRKAYLRLGFHVVGEQDGSVLLEKVLDSGANG